MRVSALLLQGYLPVDYRCMTKSAISQYPQAPQIRETTRKGLEKLLTSVFTAVALPIWTLIEKDGTKPKPSVTSFSASLDLL